jgi:hypothetical protein
MNIRQRLDQSKLVHIRVALYYMTNLRMLLKMARQEKFPIQRVLRIGRLKRGDGSAALRCEGNLTIFVVTFTIANEV